MIFTKQVPESEAKQVFIDWYVSLPSTSGATNARETAESLFDLAKANNHYALEFVRMSGIDIQEEGTR